MENFPFFLQLFEVILETTADRGETLTRLVQKYMGDFALYRMKFDLGMILLVQEIHEPHHADHMKT